MDIVGLPPPLRTHVFRHLAGAELVRGGVCEVHPDVALLQLVCREFLDQLNEEVEDLFFDESVPGAVDKGRHQIFKQPWAPTYPRLRRFHGSFDTLDAFEVLIAFPPPPHILSELSLSFDLPRKPLVQLLTRATVKKLDARLREPSAATAAAAAGAAGAAGAGGASDVSSQQQISRAVVSGPGVGRPGYAVSVWGQPEGAEHPGSTVVPPGAMRAMRDGSPPPAAAGAQRASVAGPGTVSPSSSSPMANRSSSVSDAASAPAPGPAPGPSSAPAPEPVAAPAPAPSKGSSSNGSKKGGKKKGGKEADEEVEFPVCQLELEDLRLADSLADETLGWLLRSTSVLQSIHLQTAQGLRSPELALKSESLTTISLYSVNFLTDMQLKQIMKACPNVTSLEISKCRSINFSFLESNPKLVRLALLNTRQLTDQTLTEFFKHKPCPALKQLDLSGCKSLLNPVISSRSVEDLRLLHCPQLQDTAVSAAFNHCPNLRSVNLLQSSVEVARFASTHLHTLVLATCQKLRDEAVTDLFRLCPNLLALDLGHCCQLQEPVMSHPKLEKIYLTFCVNIHEIAVERLFTSCPNLKHVELAVCMFDMSRFVGLKADCEVVTNFDFSWKGS
ncbi:unnamed protein product [Vitrella brassicaformis CCMP3155]|uniref:F-box domain-containing protein n=2 Tax=Vitrella brassicaformis TaxID=1169539 RepID=A0A0G4F2Y9_VITBC|nr:unnamed protein product [Vitrella brassicaformis CCMP3155]|eukprot:CEM06408.1 unnamed protein product [Vitrella brassicaformis CCMP3155]